MLVLIGVLLVLGLVLVAGPSVVKVALVWAASIKPLSWGTIYVGIAVICLLVVTNMVYKSIVHGRLLKRYKGNGDLLRKRCLAWARVLQVENIISGFFVFLIALNKPLGVARDWWIKLMGENPKTLSHINLAGWFVVCIALAMFLGGYLERKKRSTGDEEPPKSEPKRRNPEVRGERPNRSSTEPHRRQMQHETSRGTFSVPDVEDGFAKSREAGEHTDAASSYIVGSDLDVELPPGADKMFK